jgi:hypothetical protein
MSLFYYKSHLSEPIVISSLLFAGWFIQIFRVYIFLSFLLEQINENYILGSS